MMSHKESNVLFDNGVYSGDFVSKLCVPNLIKAIENKTVIHLQEKSRLFFLSDIEDIEDIDNNQMILKKEDEKYITGNIMGFLGIGSERLVIHSRFDKGKDNNFVKYMLSKVFSIPNLVDMPVDASYSNALFDLLPFLFPHFLHRALRKGIYKSYVRKEYNDFNIKGAIDFPRHIKMNTPFIGKTAYAQREFSFDNEITQLIRHTIEFIKQEHGRVDLTKCHDEIRIIKEVTKSYYKNNRQKVIFANQKHPVLSGYFSEYRELQKLCLMILNRNRIDIGKGEHDVYGILFDGAWLWEEYVDYIIGERNNPFLFYHPKNKAGQRRESLPQRLFMRVSMLEEKKIGLIYPDFVSVNDVNRVIADAKYKPMENVRRMDYYQLLSYMFRFDSKIGLFIYPKAVAGNNPDKYYLLRGFSKGKIEPTVRDDTFVHKYGIMIPNNDCNYNDFVEEMSKEEDQLKQYLMRFW